MKQTIKAAVLLSFVPLPVWAALPDWKTATQQAPLPVGSFYFDTAGAGISGFAPQPVYVGDFTGSRSFEFVVFAGNGGQSSALLGLTGVQGLKFEQNPNTGHIGLTDFGVADHDSPVDCPLYEETQIVYTSDGTDTLLYVNGTLRHTFTGVPLQLTGSVTLGAAGDESALPASLFDRMDGHILGFTSYDSVLTPEKIASHYAALIADRPASSLSAWQAAVDASPVAPSKTVFTPVSGGYPVVEDVGELAGSFTLEFVVYAGGNGGSSALLGRNPGQALKFEQWNETGMVGLTEFGVADHNSGVPSPFYSLTHVAYVSSDTGTDLYINGTIASTFDGIPLTATGPQGLGAAAFITDVTATFRDPLDGSVLRFASYDQQLSDAEVAAHYNAYAADAGAGAFTAWAAAAAGSSATAVHTEPVHGSAPVTVDVGPLTGDRTFEFIALAGISTQTGSLMGGNTQALKYEQWLDTGLIGMTTFGVADYLSETLAPDNEETHIVYSTDGTDTKLYVNGELSYTFIGAVLDGTGVQALAAAAAVVGGTTTYGDPLDGHILGFAAYPGALSAAQLAAHYSALMSGGSVPAGPLEITSVNRNAATGELTLTWTSTPGQKFSIFYATDLATFPAGNTVATNVSAGAGTTTTHTFTPPAATGPRLFFRVGLQ